MYILVTAINLPQYIDNQSYAQPCVHLPSEKQSGEQSQIFWAYYPKAVRTNEIVRSVIITQHFPCSNKIYSSPFKYPYFFEQVFRKVF